MSQRILIVALLAALVSYISATCYYDCNTKCPLRCGLVSCYRETSCYSQFNSCVNQCDRSLLHDSQAESSSDLDAVESFESVSSTDCLVIDELLYCEVENHEDSNDDVEETENIEAILHSCYNFSDSKYCQTPAVRVGPAILFRDYLNKVKDQNKECVHYRGTMTCRQIA